MEVNSLPQLVDTILKRKFAFVVAFFIVFLTTYALLSWLDFLPELVEKKPVTEEELVVTAPVVEEFEPVVVTPPKPQEPVFPTSIEISSLSKTINVLNPESREVADLDRALLSGIVRHPDSATLEQNGTVFLLGHSSYLPVVRNKNYQALNGIQDMKWGDTITLTSDEGVYVYRVDKVYKAKATEVTVPIAGPSKRLFLATCNSFGSTDDRFIVEADLIEVQAL